eukprot:PhM_4_TR2092/c0_g2_i2/m.29330
MARSTTQFSSSAVATSALPRKNADALRGFYKGLVESLLLFGCEVWGDRISPSIREALETVHCSVQLFVLSLAALHQDLLYLESATLYLRDTGTERSVYWNERSIRHLRGDNRAEIWRHHGRKGRSMHPKRNWSHCSHLVNITFGVDSDIVVPEFGMLPRRWVSSATVRAAGATRTSFPSPKTMSLRLQCALGERQKPPHALDQPASSSRIASASEVAECSSQGSGRPPSTRARTMSMDVRPPTSPNVHSAPATQKQRSRLCGLSPRPPARLSGPPCNGREETLRHMWEECATPHNLVPEHMDLSEAVVSEDPALLTFLVRGDTTSPSAAEPPAPDTTPPRRSLAQALQSFFL